MFESLWIISTFSIACNPNFVDCQHCDTVESKSYYASEATANRFKDHYLSIAPEAEVTWTMEGTAHLITLSDIDPRCRSAQLE